MTHRHAWLVVGSSVVRLCLLLRCECGATAEATALSAEEWNRAFRAADKPYRWKGGSDRVSVNTVGKEQQ